MEFICDSEEETEKAETAEYQGWQLASINNTQLVRNRQIKVISGLLSLIKWHSWLEGYLHSSFLELAERDWERDRN